VRVRTDMQKLRVLLFEPSDLRELAPILERRALALLTVGGKTLVEYWLETLKDLGVEEVNLAIRRRPHEVRDFVGCGERWGIVASIASVTDERTDTALRDELADASDWMAISLASLPMPGFRGWIQQPSHSRASACEHAAVSMFTNGEHFAPNSSVAMALDSVTSYWEMNMLALDDGLDDKNPPGFAIAQGQRFGMAVRVHRSAHLIKPCRIGDQTHVAEKVDVGPRVSVGARCIIETASRLRDCVVCDDTYVGSHSEIQNAVVDGRMIFHVDLNTATWVDDPLILGDRASPSTGGLIRQFAALSILLILLPVALIASLRGWLRKSAFWERESVAVPVGRSFDGSFRYREIDVISLPTQNPIRRKIPWLWQAAKGAVALVGVQARESDQAMPDWLDELDGKTPGVVSLADIHVARDIDSSREQLLIADTFYLATRSRWADLALIFRWCGAALLPSKRGRKLE
nr:hypothetical protein [Gammaproteobacteria bacterium]